MRLSFSIFSIEDSEVVQRIIKGCDAVFLLDGMPEQSKDKAKELAQGKCIELTECTNSKRIINYLQTRNESILRENEREEITTIYHSLPKGVELTVYWMRCFSSGEEPIKITLPYD